MSLKQRVNIRVCISTLLVTIFLLAQVSQVNSAKPIFNRCLDRELGGVLRLITTTLYRNRRSGAPSEIETKEKVENVMEMVKEYLADDRALEETGTSRTRKLFFWPFFPTWNTGGRQPTTWYGGMGSHIYGGMGPGGFSFGGGMNGEIHGRFR